MIRCRFIATNGEDYRPVHWPVKHPYWCSGESDSGFVVVAYADDEHEIMKNWPDAVELVSEEVTEYSYTDRFPKPDWLR